jgi:hypothetical protein
VVAHARTVARLGQPFQRVGRRGERRRGRAAAARRAARLAGAAGLLSAAVAGGSRGGLLLHYAVEALRQLSEAQV